MSEKILNPEPLTREAFKPFGDVIEVSSHTSAKQINYGLTQRFDDIANLDLLANEGRPLFNIFRSNPPGFPFRVEVIERHPLSSQLFYPLSNTPFLVLVAEGDHDPSISDLKLFITNGIQGINYNANIWHHYSLALDHPCDFIVVDRGGAGDNCQEYFLQEAVFLEPATI